MWLDEMIHDEMIWAKFPYEFESRMKQLHEDPGFLDKPFATIHTWLAFSYFFFGGHFWSPSMEVLLKLEELVSPQYILLPSLVLVHHKLYVKNFMFYITLIRDKNYLYLFIDYMTIRILWYRSCIPQARYPDSANNHPRSWILMVIILWFIISTSSILSTLIYYIIYIIIYIYN